MALDGWRFLVVACVSIATVCDLEYKSQIYVSVGSLFEYQACC